MQFKIYLPFLFLAFLGLTISGCVDQDFDAPPVGDFPRFELPEANFTIQELKDLHTLGSDATAVTTPDLIIRGTVLANDDGGNIFKQLFIEDATGGILLRLDRTGLYTQFPVGTEVAVFVTGLFVNDFNNLYQLTGDSAGDRLADPIIDNFVVGGGDAKEPVITATSLEEIVTDASFRDRYMSTLITLEDVQFADVDLGATYANPGGGGGQNRTLEDCFGNSVTVRNSDFADFAGEDLPTGNGTLTGVLSIFGSTVQVTVRLPEDLNMTSERCGVVTGGNLVTIQSLRDAYASGATQAPDDSKIRGTIISDRASGNINGQNMVIQDGSAGIVVRFTQDHAFALGEEVEVAVSGQELSDFLGLVQVNNVSTGSVTSISTGNTVTPRVATIAELEANFDAWESTLVQIADCTINGGPTYGSGTTVMDATGSIPMFTFGTSSFGSTTIPSGEGTLTAILGNFDGIQLNMRNIQDADFEGGMTGSGDPELISIADLRALYPGSTTSAPVDRFIRGVVISDVSNENITGRNLVLQDETGGIVVRFAENSVFELGEDVEVNISGVELSEFNNLLQVNNVPNGNAISYGPGTLPDPRVTTLADILANGEAWESTLVEVPNVTFPGGGTYGDFPNMEDGTASLLLFTRGAASFSGTNVPSGTVTVTGIVSQFEENYQMNIRNLNDISQ